MRKEIICMYSSVVPFNHENNSVIFINVAINHIILLTNKKNHTQHAHRDLMFKKKRVYDYLYRCLQTWEKYLKDKYKDVNSGSNSRWCSYSGLSLFFKILFFFFLSRVLTL